MFFFIKNENNIQIIQEKSVAANTDLSKMNVHKITKIEILQINIKKEESNTEVHI